MFLNNDFILGSSWEPPALLVYRLEKRPCHDTTRTSTHFLRFLLGTLFQASHGTSVIQIASDPSPGSLPSAGRVPFHIAGEERMITMHSQFFGVWGGWTFLIPVKALLKQIESLPTEDGPDVQWGPYYPWQHVEYVPEHIRWVSTLPYFVIGMRHVVHDVLNLDGKPSIIIRDLSPRRCLRASEEERKKSEALYEAIPVTTTHRTGPIIPRPILKCVPLPEDIVPHSSLKFLMSEDGILIVKDVRQICVFHS